ncbi:Uncharacterized protein APZ42_029191 [Daphnia magna]|uniref:Uncharacterized protein n=1 Tax=Daphnia magna TaxID=35525 RepID=A0A164PUY4_9CRUS|nr:Uncharacterized protein APZ42_029191 [Daphnia magna]
MNEYHAAAEQKKEFLHAAAMIFSVKNNCSGIKIFPAVWVRRIFMETGVHQSVIRSLTLAKTSFSRKKGQVLGFQVYMDDVELANPLGSRLLKIFNYLGWKDKRKWLGVSVNFAGDMPASNFMGGFKESVEFANLPCRTCMINKSDLDNIHHHVDCVLRKRPAPSCTGRIFSKIWLTPEFKVCEVVESSLFHLYYGKIKS